MPNPKSAAPAPDTADIPDDLPHDLMAAAVNELGARAGITYPTDPTPEPDEDPKKPAPAAAGDGDPDPAPAGDGDPDDDDDDAPEGDPDQAPAGEGDPEGAPEGDPDGDPDPAPAGEGDPEAQALAAETAELVNAKLKDLPKEVRGRVQSILDRRIGQIQAKARESTQALEARVTELQASLDEARTQGGAPVIIPGVNPLFLAESETEIEKRVQAIEAFEDWADKYKDGYEGDGTDKDPSYSAEQIRARARELQREKEKIIPAARQNLQARVRIDAAVRQVYPAIFDPKSPDYQARQRILKAMPELRRFADCNALVVQQLLGERAMQALLQKAAPAGKGKGQGNQEPPPVRRAPRAPAAGGAAKGSVVVHRKEAPATTEAVKKFTEKRDRRSLVDAVGALTGL